MNRSTCLRRRSLLPLLVLVCAGWLPGCASLERLDLTGNESRLELAQRQYTQSVRWGEIERASAFVADDARAEFLTNAPRLREIHFTDYTRGKLDVDEQVRSATITVTYRGYAPASLVELSGTETQIWEREENSTDWTVRPDLTGLEELMAATAMPAVGASR